MLGLLHRSVLGNDPKHARDMFLFARSSVFFQKQNKQVCSHLVPRHQLMLARSALGLVYVKKIVASTCG